MNIIKMKCDRKQLVAQIDLHGFETETGRYDISKDALVYLRDFVGQLREREGDVFVLLFHK